MWQVMEVHFNYSWRHLFAIRINSRQLAIETYIICHVVFWGVADLNVLALYMGLARMGFANKHVPTNSE